ncbi:hypothetical protein G6F53_013743 [Rhizopus delemar]|nr:hypothetical protein G6F53_013743 [Rhizopus delemar]
MDVQPHAIALGQAEQQRQLPFGIAVEGGRVDAAQYLHARGNGLLPHCGGAGAGHHPGLRERHQLDAHDVGTAQRRLAHRVQMAQPGTAIDVDVAAHRHRAEAAALADQRLGPVDHRSCPGGYGRPPGLAGRQSRSDRRFPHLRAACLLRSGR